MNVFRTQHKTVLSLLLAWAGLFALAPASMANESFIAGLYGDTQGNNYIISGPAPSQQSQNRNLWNIIALGRKVTFNAVWETGPAIGNSYIGDTDAINSHADAFPIGVSYGMMGTTSSWSIGEIISADQQGYTIHLTGLNSDGSSKNHNLTLNLLGPSNLATGSPSSTTFSAGIYIDSSAKQYLVSGPAPSQPGPSQSRRQLWNAVALDPAQNFAVVWETGPAIGNTYMGSYPQPGKHPDGWAVGRAYGISVDSAWNAGYGISASQAGNILNLTRLDDYGNISSYNLTLTKVAESSAANSSSASEAFLPGIYTDLNGTSLLVSGPAPSQSGRSQWSIASLAPDNIFAAIWETGSPIGNAYIGNNSNIFQSSNGYFLGRSYGVIADRYWLGGQSDGSAGSTIAVSQIGNIVLLSRLNSDGTCCYSLESGIFLRMGDNQIATSSPSSESFVAGTYTAQDGRVYQVQNQGNNTWKLISPPLAPYQFSAIWQTGPVLLNGLVSGRDAVKNNPLGYQLGRSYGLSGDNSLGWSSNYVLAASQTGNVLVLTLLNDGGTPRGNSMTLIAGGYAGLWNTVSSGEIRFRDSTVSVLKNQDKAKVYVNRVGGSKGPASVAWQTQDGSALSGVDYIGGSGSLIWKDGDVSTQTIPIQLKSNTSSAGKSFTVQLTSPALATLGSPSTVTVVTSPISYAANSDRLFNWAESFYPSLFPVPHQESAIFLGSYFYRCYASHSCVASGMGADIDSLYYQDGNTGKISNLGSVRDWLGKVKGF